MANILHGVDWPKKNMRLNTEAGLLRQPLSWGHPPCKEQPLEGVFLEERWRLEVLGFNPVLDLIPDAIIVAWVDKMGPIQSDGLEVP